MTPTLMGFAFDRLHTKVISTALQESSEETDLEDYSGIIMMIDYAAHVNAIVSQANIYGEESYRPFSVFERLFTSSEYISWSRK